MIFIELLHDKGLIPQGVMMNSPTFNTEPGLKGIKENSITTRAMKSFKDRHFHKTWIPNIGQVFEGVGIVL